MRSHRLQKMKIGINGKVVVAMFLVVLTIMLMIAFYSHSLTKNILLDQVEQKLTLKNEKVRNAVASVFEQKGEIIRQFSSIPVIQSFMSKNVTRENVHSDKDYEWVQQALMHIKKNNEDVQTIWLAHEKNSYFIANNDYISDNSYHIQGRLWYKQAQESKTEGLLFSSLYTDYITKEMTVSVSHPVIVDEKRLGYLGMYLHIENIGNLLKPFETNGQKLILVSDKGDSLYDSENMWKNFQGINLENTEVFKVNKDKVTYYASIRQLDELGWKIVTYIPEEVVLKPLTIYEKSIQVTWFIAIVVLLSILSFVLHYLLKDIPFIVRQINKIKHGNLDVKIGIDRKDEVGKIARAVEQMAQQIKNQIEELDFQASHDSLTGLANRNSLEKMLEKWISEMDVIEELMAVIFFDLDQFKHVNDSKGHAFGDQLLIEVGRRMGELLPKNSFFARFGGDEFVMIIRARKEELHFIHASLQQIYESFASPYILFEEQLFITSSIGVSIYPTDAQTKEDLLINADTALYQAKENGRNCISFFNNEMKKHMEKELKMKDGIRKALSNNEFSLHYQPQLDVKSGKMTSAEALIRWNHPELGMISPEDFISLSECTGQIIAIGDWVIDACLQLAKRITNENLNMQYVAMNVSSLQLREADFVEKLQQKIAFYEVDPSLLEMEITESVIIDHQEETIEKLIVLKNMGIRIALDDFGTGYSSLNYLRLMPIDRVKVDRSFIQQIENDKIVQAILKTIITLGHSLGFQIVAEGVEEEAQLQILQEMNVDSIQGYYFSRPLVEEALLEFVEKSV
ncbi:EAL domain-containing protein [Psychrobacillus sp.]|uniref:bifunctional diguanylate cyclase/phosphodiesterase n=1 Tax=Psychrobacillus sp. TaxID=1871623 RepID=UPI0028BD48CC|nr:EAL domain-containing protein [Psychrobacillus sp.]